MIEREIPEVWADGTPLTDEEREAFFGDEQDGE